MVFNFLILFDVVSFICELLIRSFFWGTLINTYEANGQLIVKFCSFSWNRSYLESESEKDMPAVMQLRLHFAHFIYKMITSVPGELNTFFHFLENSISNNNCWIAVKFMQGGV